LVNEFKGQKLINCIFNPENRFQQQVIMT